MNPNRSVRRIAEDLIFIRVEFGKVRPLVEIKPRIPRMISLFNQRYLCNPRFTLRL
jgi:hypothetical protein